MKLLYKNLLKLHGWVEKKHFKASLYCKVTFSSLYVVSETKLCLSHPVNYIWPLYWLLSKPRGELNKQKAVSWKQYNDRGELNKQKAVSWKQYNDRFGCNLSFKMSSLG